LRKELTIFEDQKQQLKEDQKQQLKKGNNKWPTLMKYL
jgi:uncharacterized protein YecA (UPF0149 family)